MSIKDKIENAREDDWLTKDFTKEELEEIKRQIREEIVKEQMEINNETRN